MEILIIIVALFLAALLWFWLLSPPRRKSDTGIFIKKATYVLKKGEADSRILSTERKPDVGDHINIKSMSNEEFFNRVTITVNGIQCATNPVPVSRPSEIDYDIARNITCLSEIIFAEWVRTEDVIQIVTIYWREL